MERNNIRIITLNSKKVCLFIVAIAVNLMFMTLGIIGNINKPQYFNKNTLYFSTGLLVAMGAFTYFRRSSFNRKLDFLNDMRRADEYYFGLLNFQNINVSKYEHLIKRELIKMRIWTGIILFGMAMFEVGLGAVDTNRESASPFHSIPLTCFYVFFRWLTYEFEENKDKYGEVSSKKYPELNKVLGEVFGKSKVCYVFCDGNKISAYREGKTIFVELSEMVLSLLTKEELRAVLTAEKIRLDEMKNSAYSKADRVLRKFEGIPEADIVLKLLRGFFFEKRIQRLQVIKEAVGAEMEREMTRKIDNQIAAMGMGKALAAVVVKTAFFQLYENTDTDYKLYYYERETNGHYQRNNRRRFLLAYKYKHEFWEKLLNKMIPPMDSGYLSYRHRLENLGAIVYSLEFPNLNEGFTQLTDFEKEQKEYLRECDELVWEANRYVYDMDRYNEWQVHQRTIENYLKGVNEGIMYPINYLGVVMDACIKTHKFDLLEEVAQECLEIAKTEREAARANLCLGIKLAHEFDESCLKCFEAAIRGDRFWLVDAYREMNYFCRTMGLARRLETYRNLYMKDLQELLSNKMQGRNVITVFHKLQSETFLPKDVIENNLRVILGICGERVDKIYQFRKKVTKDYWVVIYLLVEDEYSCISEEQMNLINYYLETLDLEYDCLAITKENLIGKKLKSIPGLVYKRDRNIDSYDEEME
ncbi:MAG: hypothetical protein K6G65_00050 [Lachnospiraceae bacterium]|nr:hypothetical protein [Lachnospiraceae bacterium]